MSSPTVKESAALALRELNLCWALVADTDDWSAATPCDGWDVEGLTRHLAAVAWQQAEAFHRAKVGVAESPGWLQAAGVRTAVLDLLAASGEHLSAAFQDVDDPATIVPLPFATLPASIAAAALVLEYGVHRADLERALTGAPEDRLDPLVARTVAGLLPALLPILADKPPTTATSYRLRGETATAAINYRDGAWRPGGGDGPACDVVGSDAAISLLALGRIPPNHPSLTVDDPAAAAEIPNLLRGL